MTGSPIAKRYQDAVTLLTELGRKADLMFISNQEEFLMINKTIWKFSFELADVVSIEMPAGAEVVSIQMQGKTPCVWAIVNPDSPLVTKSFAVVGTGHTIPSYVDDYSHKETLIDGDSVWHIFTIY